MNRLAVLGMAAVLLCCSAMVSAEGPAIDQQRGLLVTSPASSMQTSLPQSPGSAGRISIAGSSSGTQIQPGQTSPSPQLLSPRQNINTPIVLPTAKDGARAYNGTVPAVEPVRDPAGFDKAPVNADSAVDGEDLSPLEKSLGEESLLPDKAQPKEFALGKLVQFGYDYFRPESAGFAPLIDIPVGPDYIVGAGDRLVLTLWGSIEGVYELEVNRSGEIVLPRVGSVKVSGQTFGQLPSFIKANLARVFKDFQFNLNMGKLRMIKVYVVGQVKTPGDYNVSSLSTVLNVLTAAGGPTKNGTLRNIQIKRSGKLVETVDLYDFFLKGDKSRDIRLQPGDTVYVPTIGPVAGIAGTVRVPAIYELKGDENLQELLSLSGGIKPTGYLQRLQIARVEAHDKKIVTDVSLDAKVSGKGVEEITKGIRIQDMDLVKVFPIDSILRGFVRLEGHVIRPGDFALHPGMRLSDIISRENLLPEYFADAGQITRLYPPDYHPEVIFFNVAKALGNDPANDFELNEFDKVRIFSRWEMEEMPKVRIGGDVQKPGEYRYFARMTVRDLLMQAGNPKLTAFLKSAEINRLKKTGESVVAFPIVINLGEAIKGNPKDNIELEPFDEITIRRIPNWAEETDRYVTLKGEFVFPGVYPIYKGEKLSSVIERAGGFTDKAYLSGARFTRESIRAQQQLRMDEALARAQEEIIKKQTAILSAAASKEEIEATKATLDGLERSVQLLKTKKAEGRMIVRVEPPGRLKGSVFDIEVMGGDSLVVPSDPASVNVLGSVYNPTSTLFVPQKDVDYYLDQVGGVTQDGDLDNLYLVRADGTVHSIKQATSFLFYNSFFSHSVDSGDTLVVPQKIEKTAWLRDIKDITTILSQVAITAGTVLLGLR